MLFFENEIKKVSEKVGPSGWSTLQLQDPRINGQLRKEQITRKTEERNIANRRNRLFF